MQLKLANGYTLTTERAESSYGQPVLVAPNGVALGQKDHAPAVAGDDLGWLDPMYTAQQLVAGMVHRDGPCATLRQHDLVRAFLFLA